MVSILPLSSSLKRHLLIPYYRDGGPPRHEGKQIIPSGMNAPGLPDNWFWWVGSIARRSLIVVRIVVWYAL